MKPTIAIFSLLAALLLPAAAAQTKAPVHHDLRVSLDPASQALVVRDRLELREPVSPDANGGYRFLLHEGLRVAVETPGWRVEAVEGPVESSFFGINATTETVAETVPVSGWRLVPPPDAMWPVELHYEGEIHHPLAQQGEEYQRAFSETPGLISSEGVFLAGTSFWVPRFGDALVSFRLLVEGLEPPWDAVSQGDRVEHALGDDGRRTTVWACPYPTEEIYLVAGPWTEYADTAGETEVLAFLRTPDPALANRYLQATRRYLKMYESILPDYPYGSFSLVENFWETGYGMPGFTLLGPRVIRMPWILTSSYPHEILHNWWGNSVYVDTAEGNWCEGLTAYMADHMLAEQRGEAAVYRRATLKKFTDFVRGGDDVPLIDFRSRHSAASEAVGYGKSLMLFHMVRRAVGDDDFRETIKRFARRQTFRRSTYTHIANLMTAQTGILWRPFFRSWITRTGAPELTILSSEVVETGDDEHPFELLVRIGQSQEDDPFPLVVPLAVTLEGADEPLWVTGEMAGRELTIRVPCPARPLRFDVDPAFDLMRRLDPMEVPPALSTVLGDKQALFVLPSAASDDERAAWLELARRWSGDREPGVIRDDEIEALPAGSHWILGWDNRFAGGVVERLESQGVRAEGAGVRVFDEVVPREGHSLVLVARGARRPEDAVGWVASDPKDAIAGLGRKLPHYSRYSALAFRGSEPENTLKGLWTPLESPLVRGLTDGPLPELRLPPRAPLAELPPAFDKRQIRASVEHLASPKLEGRGLGSPGLEAATSWVEDRLRSIGLEPAGSEGYRETFVWTGGEPAREMTLTNLVGRLAGTDDALSGAPLVVLAHLDHLGRGWPDVRGDNEGKIHPGADDNASGVAVLLELARAMTADPPPARSVVFAVVTGEEAGRIGSRQLLDRLASTSRPVACINLDSVGRLADGKLYVLNAETAREWRFIFMGVQFTTGVAATIVSEPLDASDQVSCIERGIPAVQLFTGPHVDYHRPTDTAEKIDFEGLASVAEATLEVARYLADRREPLTVMISAGGAPERPGSGHPGGGRPDSSAGGPRRASLGTMPDFSFGGPGVRIQQVLEGTPAEAAGLRPGDVILAIDGAEIETLRGYSKELKKRAPGESIRIVLTRDGERLELTATLTER